MKPRADDRDEEVREIRDVAQKMAERVNMRFVLNDEKVRRFRGAASHGEADVEAEPTSGETSSSERVLNT